jgi:ADP-ribosylglycohydrolase
MNGNPRTAILAAFAADSLALGVHWVYDTDAIAGRHGRVASLLKPELAPYHRGKDAGDLTHYGDQMLLLMRHVAEAGAFDAQAFGRQWREAMGAYAGYVDGATRQTLANLERGLPATQAGSPSDDLSGAARLAPLLAVYADRPDDLVRAARAQAMLTHASPLVAAAAGVLARACLLALGGEEAAAALTRAAGESGDPAVADLIRRGLAAKGMDSLGAVKGFGQSCAAHAGLPGAVQIVARHGGNLEEALVENVMAGGDSAARGMFIATLLGCLPGASVPVRWLEGLRCRDEVLGLMDRLDLRQRGGVG